MRRPCFVLKKAGEKEVMKRKYAAMLLGIAAGALYLAGCAKIENFLEVQEEEGGTIEVRYQKVFVSLGEGGKRLGSAIAMIEPEDLENEPAIEYYPAAWEYAVDMETDGETYSSRGTDENAVHVYGEAQVLLKNAEITRNTKQTSTEDFSDYGMGAAFLTTSGTAYLKNSAVDTGAERGNGIFAYGDGTIYVLNTTIDTKKENSSGLRAAGGGTLYGWNLRVETDGNSSPAVKSSRRTSTVLLDGGMYTTMGVNSPAVYSAGNIAIRGGTLKAEQWEAICMEGDQSLSLYDCHVEGNKEDDISNDCTWNVILYESGSGNLKKGNSMFEMSGGSLTAKNGGIFYTTNVRSAITLSNVKIAYPAVNEFFLKCTGNHNQREWGTRGANGAKCVFTAVDQEMAGDVVWDGISELDFYMSEGSALRGAVRKDGSDTGTEGYCRFYIGEGCTWTVTGNSTVSRLSCQGTIVDDEGNAATVQGRDGTVYIQGAGKYTVTVDVYEALANMSGASEVTRWADHQVEIPQDVE